MVRGCGGSDVWRRECDPDRQPGYLPPGYNPKRAAKRYPPSPAAWGAGRFGSGAEQQRLHAALPAEVMPHLPRAAPRVSVGRPPLVPDARAKRPVTAPPKPAPLKWGVREHNLPECLQDATRWEDSGPCEAGAFLAALPPRRGTAPRTTRGPLPWQERDVRPQTTRELLLEDADEYGCRQCQVADESPEDVMQLLLETAGAALDAGANRFRSAVAAPTAVAFHCRGAFALPKEGAMGPPGSAAGREFAHIHGKYRTPACCRSAAWGPPRIDPHELKGEGLGSSHVVLSLPDAEAVVRAGWGVWHDAAGEVIGGHRLPRGYVLVYAPRDRAEVAVVVEIFRAAMAFARSPYDPTDGWGLPPED